VGVEKFSSMSPLRNIAFYQINDFVANKKAEQSSGPAFLYFILILQT
jgi:hypothetical protein